MNGDRDLTIMSITVILSIVKMVKVFSRKWSTAEVINNTWFAPYILSWKEHRQRKNVRTKQ